MADKGRGALATIILAAGQGTRMKSQLPKVLHEVAGAPLCAYPIRLALAFRADPIALVIGHGAEQVRQRIEGLFPDRVRFQVQSEQLGTGHAVQEGMKALKGFEGLVLILYGDVPFLEAETVRKMIGIHKKGDVDLVAVTLELDDPPPYGRIIRDPSGQVLRVVEHKDCTPEEQRTRELNAGIYCADAAFLKNALAKLDNKNAQGEYYLTDIVATASRARGVETVRADPGEVLGANTRADLADLAKIQRKKINLLHMLNGVSVLDPETTYISSEARIGRDTVIQPGVHIRGETRIGEGCTLDAGAIVDGCVLGDRVQIRAYSVLESATVHDGAIVGPFSRLRPEAEIFEEAHVGNFVEIKKTRLGRGAKANHLAYLGDAKIGAGTNIGAGTITCNYDGFGKYLTEIGERVFVGSNSTLVAPLKIRDDAYVAAGSAVTADVKANSLVIGRAKQVEKEGRAERIRSEAKQRAAEAKAKTKDSKKTKEGSA